MKVVKVKKIALPLAFLKAERYPLALLRLNGYPGKGKQHAATATANSMQHTALSHRCPRIAGGEASLCPRVKMIES